MEHSQQTGLSEHGSLASLRLSCMRSSDLQISLTNIIHVAIASCGEAFQGGRQGGRTNYAQT
jgi:hypothetical protein